MGARSVVCPVLARVSAGISEFKQNPIAVMAEAEGEVIAILNRNRPVFYAVPATTYERLLDLIKEASPHQGEE